MIHHWQTLTRNAVPRLRRERELAIYLLTPGFSNAYHQHTLSVSNATIWKYMHWAQFVAVDDPSYAAAVDANLASITCDDGLRMAKRRGGAHMPFWSRLAICEYLQIHGNTSRVAQMFLCSTRTVNNVVAGRYFGYEPLSAARKLSSSQEFPPAIAARLTKP